MRFDHQILLKSPPWAYRLDPPLRLSAGIKLSSH